VTYLTLDSLPEKYTLHGIQNHFPSLTTLKFIMLPLRNLDPNLIWRNVTALSLTLESGNYSKLNDLFQCFPNLKILELLGTINSTQPFDLNPLLKLRSLYLGQYNPPFYSLAEACRNLQVLSVGEKAISHLSQGLCGLTINTLKLFPSVQHLTLNELPDWFHSRIFSSFPFLRSFSTCSLNTGSRTEQIESAKRNYPNIAWREIRSAPVDERFKM
jgi:hypothetical protein